MERAQKNVIGLLILIFCLSILLVCAFAYWYHLIFVNSPSAFSYNGVPIDNPQVLGVGDFFCISAAVWTGLGFAEVIPNSKQVRGVATVETLLGSFVFIVLVALAARLF